MCWICGLPIDMRLSPQHPMGWTMDHVYPVALRPDLAEDMGNIREAHRRCNSLRGTNVDHMQGRNGSRDW